MSQAYTPSGFSIIPPEWLPENRTRAQQLQKLPQLLANHDYARSVAAAAKAGGSSLPGALREQIAAFDRTVNRVSVLRALALQAVRAGVKKSVRDGKLTPADLQTMPEDWRSGLGVVGIIIAIGVALAIVVGMGVLALGFGDAMKEWLSKDSAMVAEAKIIENNLATVNEIRAQQGLPPIVYTPGTLTRNTFAFDWKIIAVVAGAAVLLFAIARKRRKAR